jgi:hypothetical protein
MQLRKIFEFQIDRPIEGVIKADDDASLRTEVEEYVITDELELRLDDFLDAYIDYQNANGVWISGFFGSGKSHLLKMIALLLAGRTFDGLDARKRTSFSRQKSPRQSRFRPRAFFSTSIKKPM